MPRFAHITGWGIAVPEKVLTNNDLAQMVETSDEWIRTRTGIRERHIADEEEYPSTLGARAARDALRMAGLSPRDVEMIIVATSSPDYPFFPATACLVQDMLGAKRAGAFDVMAACTGFIYALSVATALIRTGTVNNALVIGTENLSRIVDWQDRNTCVLFGDAAGAFVLQAAEEPGGVLASALHCDGSAADLLLLPAGGSRQPASEETVRKRMHYIQMNGRAVFRFATRAMAHAVQEVLEKAGLTTEDVTLIIPHQANRRIIEAAAKQLRMPMERFVLNMDRYGNTSTASIPLAAYEAAQQRRLRPGDLVVLVGFGAGMTSGAVLVRWTGPLPRRPRPRREPGLGQRLRSRWQALRQRFQGKQEEKPPAPQTERPSTPEAEGSGQG